MSCPVRSSITGQPCELPKGHPMDSAVRFHRFPAPGSDDLPDAMAEYLWARWVAAERWQEARVGADSFRRIAAATGHTWAQVSAMAGTE